jgi:peptide/nickel transport system permease protein
VTIGLVLVATGWAWNARIVRAQAMAVRSKEYVAAAQVIGEHALRIVAVEMLPNLLPILASCFIGATTYAIGAQVGLEFLGLGDPSASTWGANLYWAANDAALLTGSWWLFVPTGVCVALVGFALVLVNFGLDEVSDPRLATSGRSGDVLAPTPVRRRYG